VNFIGTPIRGVYVVRGEPVADERGHFMRTFDAAEFERLGLDPRVAQCSVSFSPARFTLRGMHYQRPPHEEAKLIRCLRGRAFDVAVDVRPDSPTYRRSFGVELHAGGVDSVFVPAGCAHGFLTLEPDTELLYQIGTPYSPHHSAGIRWNDPAFTIDWPAPPVVMSERDSGYPDFEP